MEEPEAYITTDEEGNLILVDPIAAAVAAVVEDHNRMSAKKACIGTLQLNKDRIVHFRQRIVDLGKSPDEFVIVIISVDDVHGRYLAEVLMPNTDWTPHREGGKTPYARGLAEKQGIIGFIEAIGEKQEAELLKQMKDVAIVIIDYGTCKVCKRTDSWYERILKDHENAT